MPGGGAHHLVAGFFTLIYLAIPYAAAVSLGTSANPRHAAYVMVLAAIIAAPLYLTFPAVGPKFVGQKHAIPNCMPSLHMTWAILAAWFCHKRLRTLFIVFAALTAIATLITGEHYVPDLLAAIPTAAFCIWVSE